MNPWPVEAEVPEVHLPRPGHADLAGVQKFGFTDVRNVLERASARETAARVAGGALAKGFLAALGVQVFSHVTQIGSVRAPESRRPRAGATSPTSTPRRSAAWTPRPRRRWSRRSTCCARRNESLGGVFEVRAFGLVPGLGSHVSWEERLDGRIGMAMLSIQAVKGCGIGDGFDLAGPARLGRARRDLLLRRARLLPRDQPLGRHRGRDDDRRAADRALRDEAAADAHQAAAVGRHRHARAGAGAARADRLVHGPGRGRGGGGDAGDRAGRRLPRQVRRRPHRRRPRRRRGLRAAHRMEAPLPSLHRLHGRGQDVGGACRRGRARRAGRRRRPRDRAAARDDDRGVLRGARRGGVPRGRGGGRVRPARADRRAGAVARRRRRDLRARARAAARATRSCCSTSTSRRRGGGPATSAGRWPATATRFVALHAERAAALRVARRRRAARLLARARSARPCTPLRSLSRAPAGTKLAVGGGRLGQLPRATWARGCVGSGFWPVPGRRFVDHRRRGRRRATAIAGRGRRAARSRRRGAQDARHASSGCCARWRPRAWTTTTTSSRSAAAWSATSPGSAPPSTSAACGSCRCRRRSSPRSTRPTAARPGSTCRRARTTPAPTTSRPR